MIKKYVLSGVSGSGKSTTLEMLKKNYKTIDEIDFSNNNKVEFFYNLSTKKDQTAKEFFIISNMVEKYTQTLNSSVETIFDRWVIDFQVASELRIKPNNKTMYEWATLRFEEMMEGIDLSDIHYIIYTLSFDEFKNRITKRGRKNEVENINNDDTWYRNYFNKYNRNLKRILDKYNISYSEIDVNDKTANEVYEIVFRIIKDINNS